jgi:adenosylcobyric acid synthase
VARSLMVLGTGSGAGKSLIAAALCRIFADRGIKVAPFKAQNMALNSYITAEGGEIGRAQALQAEAARVEATVDMNPILLKASGDMSSQVIVQGTVKATMKAREYYAYKKEAWEAVTSSYKRLSKQFDLIVMEGAGSPAEINLMEADIVNMAAAKQAKAPAILVGDIDKGGVFASLYGTVKLLGRDSRHVKAFIINKFRGDLEILRPGLDMIREKTGKPVIGVLPYIKEIGLPEEDGLALYQGKRGKNAGQIRIVVVRLSFISNFTDFDPLLSENDVEVIFSSNPADIENAHIVIIPGTKNTAKDLLFLKEKGLDESIRKAYSKGMQIIGTCGGYQMLGKKLYDPLCVESTHKEIDGIGLLDIETTIEPVKTTCQVEASLVQGSWADAENNTITFSDQELSSICRQPLKGYEIHMGTTTGDINLFELRRMARQSENGYRKSDNGKKDRSATAEGRLLAISCQLSAAVLDGSKKANCWGTYLHGIFENDALRRAIINHSRKRLGLPPADSTIEYALLKDQAINSLANIVKENLDMSFINRIVGL